MSAPDLTGALLLLSCVAVIVALVSWLVAYDYGTRLKWEQRVAQIACERADRLQRENDFLAHALAGAPITPFRWRSN
jgi:hypothetical protein